MLAHFPDRRAYLSVHTSTSSWTILDIHVHTHMDSCTFTYLKSYAHAHLHRSTRYTTCRHVLSASYLRRQVLEHSFPHACAHTNSHSVHTSSPRPGWSLAAVLASSLVAGGQCRQPAGRSPHKRAWAVAAILHPAKLPVGPESPPAGPPVKSAPSLSVCLERGWGNRWVFTST